SFPGAHDPLLLPPSPTRRSSDLETMLRLGGPLTTAIAIACLLVPTAYVVLAARVRKPLAVWSVSLALPQWRLALAQVIIGTVNRSEEHTSELQSRENLVCRLLLE